LNSPTSTSAGASLIRSAANWQLGFVLIMLTAGYLSIAVSQIALGLALLVMLYRWAILKEVPPVTGLEKTAALLAVWALVMIPFSTHISQSLVFYRRFYLFTAIWVTAGVATTDGRRLLLLAFLLAGSAAISVYGQIVHAQLTRGFLSQRMEVAFNAMTGGALLMMIIMVAVGFLIVPGLGKRLKLAIGVAALPALLGIILPMTPSSQLGLLSGLGFMLLLTKPRLFGAFLGLLAVATVVLALFGENLMSDRMWSRVNPQYVMSGDNTLKRLDMWQGGWEMVKARPLTGVGDRGLEGLPGLIFGQAFVWAGIWYLIKRWRDLRRRPGGLGQAPVRSGWVLAGIGVWVSFYIAGFTEWYFGDAESMLIYLAIIGCALGPGGSEESAAG
jgi:O-antigen ligase